MPQSTPENSQDQYAVNDDGQIDQQPDLDIDEEETHKAKLAKLAEAIKGLDDHLANPTNIIHDDELRKSGAYKYTLTFCFIFLVCFVLAIGIAPSFSNNIPLPLILIFFVCIIGCFLSMLCIPYFLYYEFWAQKIQTAKKPEKALGRFYKAAQKMRIKPVMAALAPAARTVKHSQPINLHDGYCFDLRIGYNDIPSFKKYWKCVTNSIGQPELKEVKLIKENPDYIAAVEAKLLLPYYKEGAAAEGIGCLVSLFTGILGGLIADAILTKEGTIVIRKILVKRNGRWYFVSGELMGELDELGWSL